MSPRRLLFTLLAVCTGSTLLQAQEPYQERWRPQYHFTPAKNWMNDPNGMVYFEGEYHLFFQYNPEGDKWGHMSWGHAVSKDLLHWEHLPVALLEENDVMIFSGSVVVDWKNTSGLGKDGKPPLIALYTGHHTKKPLQEQHLAYSTDRGRTWTKYSSNPVLNIQEKDFRDPKIIWHEASKQWVMAVALPIQRQVRFYASGDLKFWKHLSDFGPAGSVEGIWECPDLFPMSCGGKIRWVLIVNIGSGAPAGGSGCQYFVGDFDGKTFVLDPAHPKLEKDRKGVPALWLDHGPDFYAAVTWSDVPATDGRRIALGWMSNWLYANDVPTQPWRSAMTVPRELQLVQTKAGPRLTSTPVRELVSLRSAEHQFGGGTAAEATAWAKKTGVQSGPLDLNLTFEPAQQGNAGVKLFVGEKEETIVSVDRDKGLVVIERTRSGANKFNPKFGDFSTAPLADPTGKVSLRILVDRCSVEVFINGGTESITALVLPSDTSRGLEFFGAKNLQSFAAIEAAPLRSVWNKK